MLRAAMIPDPSILTGLPWMRRVTPDDLPRLTAAAWADGGHLVESPTHLFEKQGEPVGYVSLGKIPLFFGWFHTQKIKARESAGLINLMENTLAAQGHERVCLLFPEHSPLQPYIATLGYRVLGRADVALKKVS